MIGYCPKCGNSCEIIFSRCIHKNGKTIYPKKAKAFPIPICNCSTNRASTTTP